MDIQGLAIPFWTEAEWRKAKAVLPDGHTFHATYAEFVAVVQAKQAQLAQEGTPSVRVHIQVDALLAWCGQRGRAVDAHARAHYAALVAAQNDSGRAAGNE